MPWGAAAIVGGAIIGAVASNSAASKQVGAETRGQDLAQDQYNQTRDDQAPYREAGYDALGQIKTGMADGGQFSKTFSGLGDLSDDPGYQFRMDQGMRGVDAGAAARGGVLSGAALKGEQRFGQDYASGEYQNAFNRYTSQQTNAFNRLASVAGIGQTAANQTAAAGQANVQAQTDATIGAANASASGTVGIGNAVSNGGNSLANWYQQQQYLSKMGTTGSGYTTPSYTNSNANNPSSSYLPSGDAGWGGYTGG